MSPASAETTPCDITVAGSWMDVLKDGGARQFRAALVAYLPRCRWYQSKARVLEDVSIVDVISVGDEAIALTLLETHYADGGRQTYTLPLAFAVAENPPGTIARLCAQDGGEVGVLYDAVHSARFRTLLIEAMQHQTRWSGQRGAVQAMTTRAMAELFSPEVAGQSQVMGREQSNTSIRYGQKLILKLVRHLEPGLNPELEIGRFLTEYTDIRHIPLLAGYMEYDFPGSAAGTLAVLQSFVENQGDAWEYTLGWLARFYQQKVESNQSAPQSAASLVTLAGEPFPPQVEDELGGYLTSARRLGQRTAELHLALASAPDDARFRPEAFDMGDQQTLYESAIALTRRNYRQVQDRLGDLPPQVVDSARAALEQQAVVETALESLRRRPLGGMKIRVHGDYHLGQVLYTGDDFVIVDFEGEPARPVAERDQKSSPLRDVAGLLRSFDYASYSALPGFGVTINLPESALTTLEPWARYWRLWTSVAYLQAYLDTIGRTDLLPQATEDLETLLNVQLLEKAVYELGYEVNNRPAWLKVPAQAILRLTR